MKVFKTFLLLVIALGLIFSCSPKEEESKEAAAPADPNKPYAGTVVNIFGAFVDVDAERFDASMKVFEERTGIDVVYEGSGDFESLITVRVEGGDPPDLAAFPQPGLLNDFVQDGVVIDMNDWFDMSYLKGQYIDSWLEMATMGDIMAGVWYRANVKSLVWYPKKAFDAAGYKVPETWDEMIALSDQMVADGRTPWTISMESSGATGWVATDWMEDIMLRTAGAEKYDAWVKGELPFNSPEVKRAAEIMGEIFFNPDYVYGGTTAILTVPFGDGPTPMMSDPPKAWLHRQASFIPGFFPEKGAEIERGDIDFFYLPPIDPALGKPVLGAGDIYAAFTDRPEVREVMKFLTTGESTKEWCKAGGFVSPHKDADINWYPTEADKKIGQILLDATTFRFDGSDMMPGSVGAGTFWTGMVDYVSGQDLTKVMQSIDSSWPE